jgi:hypothetical protein
VFTRERTSLSSSYNTFANPTFEAVAGVTVAKVQEYSIQLMLAAGSYSRFDSLETVSFQSFTVGVSR